MSDVTPPDDLEMTIDLGARREVVEAAYAEHGAAGTVPEETLEVTSRRARPVVADDSWTVAGRTFRSRLIVGTGKYKDFAQNAAAVEASGAEIVTVAVRRACEGAAPPTLRDAILGSMRDLHA